MQCDSVTNEFKLTTIKILDTQIFLLLHTLASRLYTSSLDRVKNNVILSKFCFRYKNNLKFIQAGRWVVKVHVLDRDYVSFVMLVTAKERPSSTTGFSCLSFQPRIDKTNVGTDQPIVISSEVCCFSHAAVF